MGKKLVGKLVAKEATSRVIFLSFILSILTIYAFIFFDTQLRIMTPSSLPQLIIDDADF